MLNSEKPDQIRGLDTIYSFKGSGDVSYRISFKTQGAPTARLYYAAGARSVNINKQRTITNSMSNLIRIIEIEYSQMSKLKIVHFI